MPFNQSMSVPLELRLVSTDQGPRLTMNPVEELKRLRERSHELGAMQLKPGHENPLADLQVELVDVEAVFEPGPTSQVEFVIRGAKIRYDARSQQLSVNDHRVPAPLRDGKQRLRILCDRTGLEVFANDGLTFVPMPYQPQQNDRSIALRVEGEAVKFDSLDAHELKSAWLGTSDATTRQ